MKIKHIPEDDSAILAFILGCGIGALSKEGIDKVILQRYFEVTRRFLNDGA